MVQNPVELDGLRKAHIRDGAAVVQYGQCKFVSHVAISWTTAQLNKIAGANQTAISTNNSIGTILA